MEWVDRGQIREGDTVGPYDDCEYTDRYGVRIRIHMSGARAQPPEVIRHRQEELMRYAQELRIRCAQRMAAQQ